MNKTLITAVLGVVIAVSALFGVQFGEDKSLGGNVFLSEVSFREGIRAGRGNSLVINSSSQYVGPVTASTSGTHTGDFTGKFAAGTDITPSTDELTKATLQADTYFGVDLTLGSVALTFPELDAADVGKKLMFVLTTASSGQTVTTSSVGVMANEIDLAMHTDTATSTSIEDVGDYIECWYWTASSRTCAFYGKD